jgi:uncharacterized cupredoxin-like copper-binding protein
MALLHLIDVISTEGVRVASIPTKALAAAIVGLTLAGCASSNGQEHGPGMMSGGSQYHYSKLTCTAPGDLPGRRVNVRLADMGMTQMMGGVAPLAAHMRLRAAPATVAAGTVTLVAMNLGWRTHELVVVPLAVGAEAGQRIPGPDGKVDETGSLGEASTSCGAGAGDGIHAGSVGWTTLTLAPGRYELLCNLRNHYADGMYQELVVTGS